MYDRKQLFRGSCCGIKATNHANLLHLKGLKSFAEEYRVKKLILVSNDPMPRKVGDIMILPWKEFLDRLWGGDILS